MLEMLQQIVFIIVLGTSIYFAIRQYRKVFFYIKLGDAVALDKSERLARFKRVVLFALGQKKMFKKWIPAVLHLCIYLAFVITQVELLEIIVDGISGTHRIFASALGSFYTIVINSIELLSVTAFFATFAFLWRRNMLKVPRFVKSEMKGWPRLDANLILVGEALLIIGIFTMNGADVILQELDPTHYPETGYLLVSDNLGPALFSQFSYDALAILERVGWWLHFIVVLGFIHYLPVSKHLHIFLAFPNAYFAKLTPRGELENMPVIANEVRSMMGMPPIVQDGLNNSHSEDEGASELPDFGAADVTQLSVIDLLGAFSCTECGRCTEVCPANITGKKLSPRKIMMDIRDRATELGNAMLSQNRNQQNEVNAEGTEKTGYGGDGKNLFDRITREELHACTTCQACVEACPVLINPMDPIIKMRRYEILTESAGPAEWIPMFNAMENGGSVWQVSESRSSWTNEM